VILVNTKRNEISYELVRIGPSPTFALVVPQSCKICHVFI